MANLNNKIARIDVLIGGADQARQQLTAMKEELKNLGQLVAKYKSDMEGSTNTVNYDRYKKAYMDADKEYKNLNKSIKETERNINTVEKYLSDVSGQTLRNLNQAKKALSQMLQGVNPNDLQSLNAVRDMLGQVGDEMKRRKGTLVEFSDVMNNLGTVSTNSLGMVKQRLQDLINSTDQNSTALTNYKAQLQQVEQEEQRRLASKATDVISNTKDSNFKYTVGEAQEAIKTLQEYRKTLATDAKDDFKQIDDTIAELNNRIAQTSQSTAGFQEAMKQGQSVVEGEFKGSVDDLEKLKKKLLEYREQLVATGNTKDLSKINQQISAINAQQERMKGGIKSVDDVIKNIKTEPLNNLKAAAATLQKEMEGMTRGTTEYIAKMGQLRQVNEQISTVNKSWDKQSNYVQKTIQRLTAYVAVYGSFNYIKGFINRHIKQNFELSDSLTDIRKVTGMTIEDVNLLSKSIDEIDTRTSQKALHDLAYEAGKLGITGRDNVLQFVKAGNQLTIALGEELGGAEAVRSLMKINDLLGETKRLGIEKALLSTGSAINLLAMSSTASAGPIVELISRLGAVGSAAKLSMADLAAFGSTSDALAQSAEVSGTAISKFINAIRSNTLKISMDLGLNDNELKQLMDTGHTMEAAIKVLEALREKQGAGGVLKEIFKDVGGEGERMIRVITSLSNNVEVLQNHVDMSRQAFEEATSVTNEYNIKNESAMAISQRLANTWREIFVNSRMVETLGSIMRGLMDIVNWILRTKAVLVPLNTVLLGISSWFAGLFIKYIVQSIKVVGVFRTAYSAAMLKAGEATTFFGKTVNVLKASFAGLWKVIKTNPIGTTILVVTELIYWFKELSGNISEAEKITQEYNEQLTNERIQVEALFNSIKNENLGKENKIRLIGVLNQKYGQYLGFMVSEKDSAEKLAAAYDLINAKLQEQIGLKMQQSLNDNVAEKYSTKFLNDTKKITRILNLSTSIGESNSTNAINTIQEVISNNIQKDNNEIIAAVFKELRKYTEVKGDKVKSENNQRWLSSNIYDALEDLIDHKKEFDKELNSVNLTAQTLINSSQSQILTSTNKMLGELADERKKLLREVVDGKDEEALRQHNKRLAENGKATEKLLNDLLQKENNENMRQKYAERIQAEKEFVNQYEVLAKKRINIWGEGETLETASVDKLVAKYKQLFDERKTLNEDANYATAYSAQFKDRAEGMKWYLDELKLIEAQLKKMGYDTSGNFLKEKKGRKTISFNGVTKTEEEIKAESNAAISALEAYYNREKGIIQQNYIDKQITEQEMNDSLLKMDEKFLKDRIQLRRKLLGKQSSFDKEKYKQDDPETGERIDYYEGRDLDQLSGFLRTMGTHMTDGILRQLTIDELKILEEATKHMQKINKIILDEDPTGQVMKQYQDELEALQLFWAASNDHTQEAARKRLELLRSLAKESYNLDVSSLRTRLQVNEDYNKWLEADFEGNITEEKRKELEALLVLLRKFDDELEEAENKELARRKRIADKKWTKSGKERSINNQNTEDESSVKYMQALQDIGIGTDSMVEDAEILMYKHRLAAAEEYFEYLKAAGADTTDAEQKRNEAMQALSEKEMDITKRKLETLKKYTDAVVTFGEQMGEAAFGEVSSRKEAAKQLLQTTMNVTKELLMEEIKRFVMKEAMKKKEVALEAATEAQKSNINATGAVTDLTVDATKAAAETTVGISSGAAKTIGELGWWGIPLIAVISAALSALMSAAMGSISKAKSEIASTAGVSSGNGKVAAGMLTYAEGNYPVLGNDGQVYNAKYESKLQTGVYKGGSHFGIFSEKKPEMIVDGDTTKKLMLNYPAIYESILTIAKHGRLQTMQTFAEGSYPQLPQSSVTTLTESGVVNEALAQTLNNLQRTMRSLNERLSAPLQAEINPYGKNGAVNRMNTANRWASRRGIQP